MAKFNLAVFQADLSFEVHKSNRNVSFQLTFVVPLISKPHAVSLMSSEKNINCKTRKESEM